MLRKAIITTLLLFVACGLAFGEVKGHKVRGNLAYVMPTGELEESARIDIDLDGTGGGSPGAQVFNVDLAVEPDDALGLRFAWEILFTDRVGLNLGLGFSNHDADLHICTPIGDIDAGGELLVMPFTASVLFHVTPEKNYDIYVGPTLGYVFFGDYEIDDNDADVDEKIDTDDDFGFGAEVGIDVPFGEKGWFFNAGVSYLKAAAELDGGELEVDVDPWIITAGFGYAF